MQVYNPAGELAHVFTTSPQGVPAVHSFISEQNVRKFEYQK